MSARRRGSLAPLALAAAAVALMIGPRGLPQSARATAALALVPLRATALGVHGLLRRAFGPDASPDELAREREYHVCKLQEMHIRNQQLLRDIEGLSGVRAVLPDPELKLLRASVVVTADATAWRRTLVIARGSTHGVQPGQLVLWEKHVVGRVLQTGPWSSRVLLLTDPAFKVGAVTVPRYEEGPTAASARDTGVFEGTGERHGVLKWLSGDTAAEEGAIVVTTADPLGGVPRGLVLGRVAAVSRSRAPSPRVDVEPFVNPLALESVVVVLGAAP